MNDADAVNTGEIYNDTRKTSVKFGLPVLDELLQSENLKTLVRAHEEQTDGYKFHRWNGTESSQHPCCITIFSAPNYCQHENEGAIFFVSPN